MKDIRIKQMMRCVASLAMCVSIHPCTVACFLPDVASRNFFRVVVMDTYEFWHPVELAK